MMMNNVDLKDILPPEYHKWLDDNDMMIGVKGDNIVLISKNKKTGRKRVTISHGEGLDE